MFTPHQLLFFAQCHWTFVDWCGVIGAFVGCLGLGVSIWTLYNTDSIKRKLKRFNNKHLLVVRIPDHIKELRKIAKEIAELTNPQNYIQTMHIDLISRSQAICGSIKEKIDVLESKKLVSLNALESFLRTKSRNVSLEDMEDFLTYVSNLRDQLVQMQEDTKKDLK